MGGAVDGSKKYIFVLQDDTQLLLVIVLGRRACKYIVKSSTATRSNIEGNGGERGKKLVLFILFLLLFDRFPF